MRAWVLVVACSGCSSILGIDDFKVGGDGGTGDGADAASIDAPPGCLGSGKYVVCPGSPSMSLTIVDANGASFNTDTSPLCAAQLPEWATAGHKPACFVIATSITVDTTMRTTGTRPLVLIATNDAIAITSTATIDVASHQGQPTRAAGSPSKECLAPSQAQAGGVGLAGGGGAGGSHKVMAGNGGTSEGGLIIGGTAAPPSPVPMHLLAGCDGGFGGQGNGAASIGGQGGGAAYLVAKTRIVIGGVINASGAGGTPGSEMGGGAGGGSGGMIVLHAPSIEGGGTMIANGGGCGSGSPNGVFGMPGEDPDPLTPFTGARGGGTAGGGGGGSGFAGTQLPQSGFNGGPGRGGGGGGGAAGFIRTNVTPAATLKISPAAMIEP